MKAPKIHSTGKKSPKKNIHPCPLRSVINPSVNTKVRYRTPPKPIAHHMVPSDRFAHAATTDAYDMRTVARRLPEEHPPGSSFTRVNSRSG